MLTVEWGTAEKKMLSVIVTTRALLGREDDSVNGRAGVRSLAHYTTRQHGRYVIFQMAEVAIPRQMFQEILRLIAELRPHLPPAPARGVRWLCIQELQMGGVRPNARENGRNSPSGDPYNSQFVLSSFR